MLVAHRYGQRSNFISAQGPRVTLKAIRPGCLYQGAVSSPMYSPSRQLVMTVPEHVDSHLAQASMAQRDAAWFTSKSCVQSAEMTCSSVL